MAATAPASPSAYRERTYTMDSFSGRPYSEASSSSSRSSYSVSSNGSEKYDPLVKAFNRFLDDRVLKESLKPFVYCLDSGSFRNVSIVTVENLLAFMESDSRESVDLDVEISSRLRYGEAALMSAASLVYNFVFASAFTVLSLATYIPNFLKPEQKDALTNQMSKLWVHTVLAAVSCGVGLAGAVMPEAGLLANFASLPLMKTLLERSEPDFVPHVKDAYQANREALIDAAHECCSDSAMYRSTFGKFFDALDDKLNRTRTLGAFIDVVQTSFKHLPDDLMKVFGLKLLGIIGHISASVDESYGPKIRTTGENLVKFLDGVEQVRQNCIEKFNSSEYVIMAKEKINQAYSNWTRGRSSSEGPTSSSRSPRGSDEMPSMRAYVAPTSFRHSSGSEGEEEASREYFASGSSTPLAVDRRTL